MTNPGKPSAARYMGSMWLYTVLRFAMFFALWGILVLVGLTPMMGALVAVLLSVPLSFVLLAGPRKRFAAQLEERINTARTQRSDLDKRLSGEDD